MKTCARPKLNHYQKNLCRFETESDNCFLRAQNNHQAGRLALERIVDIKELRRLRTV